MQDDLRRELDSGNPDLRVLQAYGTAKVTLAQHAMRQVLEASPATVLRDTEGREVGAIEDERANTAPKPEALAAALTALQSQLPPTLADLGEAIGSAAAAIAGP